MVFVKNYDAHEGVQPHLRTTEALQACTLDLGAFALPDPMRDQAVPLASRLLPQHPLSHELAHVRGRAQHVPRPCARTRRPTASGTRSGTPPAGRRTGCTRPFAQPWSARTWAK